MINSLGAVALGAAKTLILSTMGVRREEPFCPF